MIPPLLIATVWFRRRSDRAYGRARESIATVNANFQENLSGVRVAQAYVREDRNIGSFRAVGREYLGAPARRAATRRPLLPVRPVPRRGSPDAIVLGVGLGARRQRHDHASARSSRSCCTSTSSSRRSSSSRRCSTRGSRRGVAGQDRRADGDARRARPSRADPVDPGRVDGAIRFDDVHFRVPDAPSTRRCAASTSTIAARARRSRSSARPAPGSRRS